MVLPSPIITTTSAATTQIALPTASHFSCARWTPEADRHAETCRHTKAIHAARKNSASGQPQFATGSSVAVRQVAADVDVAEAAGRRDDLARQLHHDERAAATA